MKSADEMITCLTPDINIKCAEIKTKQREKATASLFVVLCIAFVTIPTLLVLFGISIIFLIVSAAFVSVAFLLLSPILYSGQGGKSNEKVKFVYKKA